MTKTSAELEREVEASRGDLDRTVEALKEKMTPGQLFDEASRAMGGAGQQVLSKFVEQAKENPMPQAVMGLGLAWLMSSNNNRPGYSAHGAMQEPRSFAQDAPSSAGGMGASAGDTLSGAMSGAKETLSHTTSVVGDGARRASEAVRTAAADTTEKARGFSQGVRRGFGDMLESEPLLIGAAALVAGAVVGAALPASEAEDRAIGSMRDKALDRGKEMAADALQQAQGAATAAYSTVKSELQASGDDDDRDPAQKAEDIARRAAQAARDEFQGQQPS